MFGYISNFVKFMFNFDNQNDVSDKDKEHFLAEELLELEIQADAEKEVNFNQEENEEVPNLNCFKKTGVITYCGGSYVLIDGMIYHDISNCLLHFNINDSVLYLGYYDSNGSTVVVRILENNGLHWGDEDISNELKFDVIEHILVGQVSHRQDRYVHLTDSDVKFSLDDVEATFVPIQGDWIELKCHIQQDNSKLSDISMNQVLSVISIKPLRTKFKQSVITEWTGSFGTCERKIYFNSDCIRNGQQIQVGSKVMLEAIESNQGSCGWRALKFIVINSESTPRKPNNEVTNEETDSLALEEEKKIEVTFPIVFNSMTINNRDNIVLYIKNKSNQVYTLNKWIVLSKKRDSQINLKPFLNAPITLAPGREFTLTITCTPRFYGNAKEPLIFLFKGFQIKRIIEINVVDEDHHFKVNNICGSDKHLSHINKAELMCNIRKNKDVCVPGGKLMKSPNFIAVRIGGYVIPDKLWSLVLGDSEQTVFTTEFDKIVTRIEQKLPFLCHELSISNYIDKWHALLYIEEIQVNINMRVYDRNNVFLIQHQEYLGIEILGLREKKPSLIKGDRVIVRDAWNVAKIQYEGYIHLIKGNLVLMKFSPQFHENYTGSDVSIEFHFSRNVYRRLHHSINMALSNLGPDVLFASRIKLKQPQLSEDKLENIKWFNDQINDGQKRAITNILKAECRPMPYIIFGPPGTGKTVTVIEAIVQILSLIPESRILVATPSNSASNLITERLLKYKDLHLGSIVRIIANHLIDSDSLPDIIKPFCATIDISAEKSSKSRHTCKDTVNLNCPSSFIARNRVIIGTCNSLGAMKHWDIPRGHFTHVIVDEAGQSTEPEIMVALTFIEKENGQLILAGDPKQLGPVVVSRYCQDFGMEESFLARLLERFPYQKDTDSFHYGYDNRLITMLNENYRSLETVLKLPSEMFYDGYLIPKFDKNHSHFEKYLKATSSILQIDDCNNGDGIFVYGIKGCNMRAEDSPSWYNPQEASMVALTACKLYKNDVTSEEIGIVTPYIAQVKYLRLLFDSMGLPLPKIGTVEDFQGQERPIILISTVRSTEALVDEDVRHSLGFLRSPKRLNVALTRAQVSVIIFCNPHLLLKDSLWGKVITHAITNDKYTGCDLPSNTDTIKT